ncbi:unnamed protein product [Somion occarium]|uniref:F-box domain-containing protein n=1 Tax=Somion occarium TaxID=3059160 RepID=A0ABP1DYZ4_9APHY
MAAIFTLPVELISRIFTIGVEEQPEPEKLPPATHTFEVLVSHVCRHWRDVALHTPGLWTNIHFRTIAHMTRAKEYLVRSHHHLLNIDVDTTSEEEHQPGYTLFREEFDKVFNIVVPHIDRWLSLSLKVRDLECKAGARRVLNTCGPAPHLQHLQLWHIEDWGTAERLYTAIGPPPVVVFDGKLPSLRSISLIGVNLPWINSPFLQNLTSIELALHSDEVRIPYDLWYRMLAQSPHLLKLSLHYSGPRLGPSGGVDWSEEKIHLPSLKELSLTDMDNPEYVMKLFRLMSAPDVRVLRLEAPVDQDFTPFLEYLADPPSDESESSHPQSPEPLSTTSDVDDTYRSPTFESPSSVSSPSSPFPPSRSTQRKPGPVFPLLESLTIGALECSPRSWHTFLQRSHKLERLDLDLSRMHKSLFDALFSETSGVGVNGTNGTSHTKGKGKERALDGYPSHMPPTASSSASTSSSVSSSPSHSQSNGSSVSLRHQRLVAHSSDQHDVTLQTNDNASNCSCLLPNLQTVRFTGLDADRVCEYIRFRRSLITSLRNAGHVSRMRKWILEERLRDEGMLMWMRENGLMEVNPPPLSSTSTSTSQRGSGAVEWDGDEEKERVEWFRDDEDEELGEEEEIVEGEGEEEEYTEEEEQEDEEGEEDS